MVKELVKDSIAMLNSSKDMPKIKDSDQVEIVKRYGDTRMPMTSTIDCDGLMKQVPRGKYPDGTKAQKAKLEAEGFSIITNARSKQRYYVENFDKTLATLTV